MATKNWYIWLICGTLLGILATVLFNKGCVSPKVVEHRIYKSDTIVLTIDKWQHDTLPIPYETILPEHVVVYETPDTITIYKDTSLMGNIPSYSGRFRDYPHLIEGDFTNDSLSLTLWSDTSGKLVKRTWPLNYKYYNYHFRKGDLLGTERVMPEKEPLTIPKGITTSSNAYAYYSILHGGFKVAADFWVTKQRWSIGAIGELGTYTKYGDIRLGAKYSIK